jgi:hypothetical protein
VRVRAAGFAIALVLVFACLAPAGTALAGELEGTQTTGVSEPVTGTSGAEPVTGATGPETGTTSAAASATDDSSGDSNRGIAIVIFALGAVAVALAYAFYDGWRRSYERLALSALKTTGTFPDTIFNPVEESQFRTRALDEGQSPPKLVVTGPAAVIVGEPAVYRATVDGAAGDACAWTIDPEDAASVQPATGAEVTVIAGKAGTFTLNAKIDSGEPTPVKVTAIARDSGGGVPLLGSGFAGFTAAIFAIALAGGLAALKILGSEAFIAFLGPLVGYFFAQSKDTGSSSST